MSMTEDQTLAQTPAHVPPELVRDFDLYEVSDPDGDIQLAFWRMARSNPPIFWTPRNGGHWVTTRGSYIKAIQLDSERFSMTDHSLPQRRNGIPSPPIDLDPPQHGPYRALLSPFFSPKALAEVREGVQATAEEVVARVAPRGECEFMSEVAKHLPIIVFLRMMGLPLEHREMLLDMSERYTRPQPPEQSRAVRREMREYMREQVEDHRAHPRDDVLTKLVGSKIDGRALSEDDLLGMCTLLLSGGLDTVKSFMGFALRFLARNPGHAKQLADEPSLIPAAIEELLRRHGISTTARLIMHDMDFHGVPLHKGESIHIPGALVGTDPELVEDPLEVDFRRPLPSPHVAFGTGPHTCPGARLARMEIQILLETWLKAIPQFQVKPGTTPRSRSGMTNSMKELWLSWPVAAN